MPEMNKDKRHSEFNKEVKDEEIKKQIEAHNKIKSILEQVSSTEEGIEFLKLLHTMSYFNSTVQGFSAVETLIFQKGKTDTYEKIRNFIPKEVLSKIEIYK
jgi:hypothetical protein